MDVLNQITQEYMKSDVPAFNIGDTVKVHVKIKEGNRERIQIFEASRRHSRSIHRWLRRSKLSDAVRSEEPDCTTCVREQVNPLRSKSRNNQKGPEGPFSIGAFMW